MRVIIFCTADGTRWHTQEVMPVFERRVQFDEKIYAWPYGTEPKIGDKLWVVKGKHVVWWQVEDE